MTALSAILLGFIQGVAEFLPISSSGHLAVLQNVFHLQTAENGHMLFDVMLHLGTVAAIVIAYWKDIRYIIQDSVALVRSSRGEVSYARKDHSGGRLLLMLFFGSLPLILILPIHDAMESLYYKTGFIGAAFLLTGGLLYAADKMSAGRRNERTMLVRDALLIGLCQAAATIPGISRSGATIGAGLATGHTRAYSMKYSLLLSVPAVLGANFLTMIKAFREGVDWSCFPAYLLGTAVAFGIGYVSIILMKRIVKKGRFDKFAYYMWGVGIFTLIASLF